MIRRAAFLALALTGAIAAIAATPREQLAGNWSFQTDIYDGHCRMTGQLYVKPSPRNGVFTCTLRATETCGGDKYSADQTCTLSEKTGAVTITSKIVKASVSNYFPDDFTLKVENASRMRGQLRSAGLIAPVLFFRGPDMLS
jgi:hypothetical protein